MPATELPKGLSHKKAQAWLTAHPEVNENRFWRDQSAKNTAKSQRWSKVSVVAFSISLVAQILYFIARAVGV